MRTLIAGVGALGGTIATRAATVGMPVWLATRSEQSARLLAARGLRVSGVGGEAVVESVRVSPLEDYADAEKFDCQLVPHELSAPATAEHKASSSGVKATSAT